MDNIDKKVITKELLNLVKPSKKLIVISIFILIITILSIITSFYLKNKPMPVLKNAITEQNENVFVQFETKFATDCFAQYKTDSYTDNFYFVMDDDYIMIAKLDSENFKKLTNIIKYTYSEIDDMPEPQILYGITRKIPNELKNLAISSYNEMFGEDLLNSSNFEDFMGTLYLDTSCTPYSNYILACNIIALIGGIYTIVVFILYLTSYIKSNTTIKRVTNNGTLDDIYTQFKAPTNTSYSKQNIMFLNDYVISYHRVLEIIKYQDIVWFYEYTLRRNGFETNRYMIVLTKDGKKHYICTKATLGKNYQTFKEIFTELMQLCPYSLVGYTKENIIATNKNNLKNTIESIELKYSTSDKE